MNNYWIFMNSQYWKYPPDAWLKDSSIHYFGRERQEGVSNLIAKLAIL